MEKDIQNIGIYDPDRNYNELYQGTFGTGFAPPTQEEWLRLKKLRAVVDSSKTELVKDLNAAVTYDNLPDAVDNSQTPWFPPIGNQGSEGSCTAFALAYYIQTYTEAKEHGWDISQVRWVYPDPSGANNAGGPDSLQEKIMSPDFLYHLINRGQDNGSGGIAASSAIVRVGGVPWSLMPYDVQDHTSWPGEEAWRITGAYRGREVGSHYWENHSAGYFIIDDDADIQLLKKLLAEGYCVSTSISSNEVFSALSGQDIVNPSCRWDSTNHAQTIVGYSNYVNW